MQEDDRIAFPNVDVRHFGVVHAGSLDTKRKVCRYLSLNLRSPYRRRGKLCPACHLCLVSQLVARYFSVTCCPLTRYRRSPSRVLTALAW